MNPNGVFWWDLFGRLFVESSVMMALATLATPKMSPQLQRKVWQVALAMLMLLFVIEGTGLHQRMHFRAAQGKAESTSRRITIQIMPAQAFRPVATQPGIAKSFSGTWLPGIVWLAVFGAVVGRSFGSRLLFMACKSARWAVSDPNLQQTLEALAARMNVRGRIHLSQSRLLAGPIAFSWSYSAPISAVQRYSALIFMRAGQLNLNAA